MHPTNPETVKCWPVTSTGPMHAFPTTTLRSVALFRFHGRATAGQFHASSKEMIWVRLVGKPISVPVNVMQRLVKKQKHLNIKQSNLVITNSFGPSIFVRYNRVDLRKKMTNLPWKYVSSKTEHILPAFLFGIFFMMQTFDFFFLLFKVTIRRKKLKTFILNALK